MNLEKFKKQAAEFRAMLQEMIDDGCTKEDFLEAIHHLDKLEYGGARFMKKLIQAHVDSLC